MCVGTPAGNGESWLDYGETLTSKTTTPRFYSTVQVTHGKRKTDIKLLTLSSFNVPFFYMYQNCAKQIVAALRKKMFGH
jgi:hypothetical protein